MIVHKIIVLIPTYNECENIEAITRAVMAQPIKNINLLIIDDNSPDGTASMVKKMMPEFPGRLHIIEREGKQGLGTAYIAGFKWALAHGYDYIFEMDADFSHNPNDLVKLYNACEIEHAQLAIGSRYKSGVNVVNWPMGRVLMSYFASIYVRMITGMKIMDTTAGFKCYHREVLKTIDLDKIKFKGYAFQIEMKFLTWKYGFHIVEVPIVFTDRRQGSSKMSGGIFSEAVWGVVQMKLRSLFKKYKRESHVNTVN
ncbi:MAG TPA: dolichyl-phosphate beta-D-mannosyltransferase [Marinilabiliaceae bacterium]|nr:dolichyl-phosphate beta-D-mannosyltransferase [Marinilabiliaceae bacterium]